MDFMRSSNAAVLWLRKIKRNNFTFYTFVVCVSTTFVLVFFFLHRTECTKETRLVCYYGFPGSPNDLQPSGLNRTLCTHIIVGFAGVRNDQLAVSGAQIETLGELSRIKGDDFKLLLSVGGAGNSNGFADMVRNHTSRKQFIRSVRLFLKANRIDGIDLDWEYPNALGMDPKERLHFTQLLEEFRATIDRYNYKFLLSVAVPTLPILIDNSYIVRYVNEYVDFVNLMSYDFHYFTKLTPFTGLNSPLYQSSLDRGPFSALNINDSTNYWVALGMSKHKMNVGLPTYGHTFRLINRSNNGLYSPAKGYGNVGSNGFAGYTDICVFMRSNGTKFFDSATESPYFVKGLEWISYDNNESLAVKTRFVVGGGFGGVMVYSLNSDDFGGRCGENFALVGSVRENINRDC